MNENKNRNGNENKNRNGNENDFGNDFGNEIKQFDDSNIIIIVTIIIYVITINIDFDFDSNFSSKEEYPTSSGIDDMKFEIEEIGKIKGSWKKIIIAD